MGASSTVSGFWAVILGCCFASIASSSSSSGSKYYRRAFPILQSDPDHIRLRLAREGLQAIQDITTPVAAVAVIGPYRSGKSFLLNQLLSLPCNEGFEVGHMRHAKTKGLWVWGIPVEVVIDGSKVSVLYLDTEGFENVRKSNVYDDRIFALATLISSVLIYNLPETVREADISRLSFAVEIAEEFYGRMKGKDVVFEPAKLLWLIQRDYLQGSSVQEMVNEGLRPVPNKSGDKNIDQVNKIRKSLARMANNISAFGLPQPHLQRTKLCDMKDTELDPLYVQNREHFKQLVASIIRPKIVQGKTLNGKEFIAFLKQTLDALNKGEIPSTGSIVEVFNKAILERCLKLYSQGMSKLQLPVPENKLQLAHEVSKAEAKKLLDQQLFGRRNAKESLQKFNDEIKKVYENHIIANKYQSSKQCEASWSDCENRMDRLLVVRLPSMTKFNASFTRCNRNFERDCVGVSKEMYALKMAKTLEKSRSLFFKEYCQRLTLSLLVLSITIPAVGHTLKFTLLKYGGYIMLIFSLYFEMHTRIYGSSELLHNSPSFQIAVAAWEIIVGNILVLNRWAIPVGILLCVMLLCWLFYNMDIVVRRQDGVLIPKCCWSRKDQIKQEP
uniref:GB1/RHD3-type G domain-containing protein n=1 Tax=Musa acuminata subsp. malaccensis TaxID=214687 RepID=A0A804IV64_MUSAM|nr:PREDICTED: guanylate-binding protein 5-like isoform X2 [Musa acuminata subsp. malaccensis]